MRLFPRLINRLYTHIVDAPTLNSFLEELDAIEKDAGLRYAIKAGTSVIRGAGAAANKAALKGLAKVQRFPGGSTVLHHVLNPGNTPDLAQSLGNAARFLGG